MCIAIIYLIAKKKKRFYFALKIIKYEQSVVNLYHMYFFLKEG